MAKRFNLDKALANAARRTVNKLITKSKTEAGRRVREIYNVKAKDLNRSVKIKRANFQNMEATLTVRGRKIPVYMFSPRQTRQGVSIRIRKDRGRKVIGTSFIATMPSGHIGVFQRKTKKRYPIKELYSVSPAQMYEQEGMKAVSEMIEKEGGKILQHEIDYEMSKLKR